MIEVKPIIAFTYWAVAWLSFLVAVVVGGL